MLTSSKVIVSCQSWKLWIDNVKEVWKIPRIQRGTGISWFVSLILPAKSNRSWANRVFPTLSLEPSASRRDARNFYRRWIGSFLGHAWSSWLSPLPGGQIRAWVTVTRHATGLASLAVPLINRRFLSKQGKARRRDKPKGSVFASTLQDNFGRVGFGSSWGRGVWHWIPEGGPVRGEIESPIIGFSQPTINCSNHFPYELDPALPWSYSQESPDNKLRVPPNTP